MNPIHILGDPVVEGGFYSALGNPHPQLLKKHYHLWLELAVPVCVEFARALRLHLTPLLAPDRAAPRGPARVEGSAAAGQPARHAHPPAAPPDDDPGASSDSSPSSMVDDAGQPARMQAISSRSPSRNLHPTPFPLFHHFPGDDGAWGDGAGGACEYTPSPRPPFSAAQSPNKAHPNQKSQGAMT